MGRIPATSGDTRTGPLEVELALIYAAMRHHREILDLDYALDSADFTQLMELTGIDSYDELFGKDGESGCEDSGSTHANSTPGLPNLEAQLLIEHAELITEPEKKD